MIHTGDTDSRTGKLRMAHPLLVDDIAVDFPDEPFENVCWRTAARLFKLDEVALGSRGGQRQPPA